MEQRDMVMFSKCSGLMYAFVIYTLQMILNGGWKRAQRFKCCPLALGSVPYTTATEWNWPKCKGMFTMFERKFHPHFFMSLNYQYECLFSSSLQVRRGCLVWPSEKCWIMRELHLVARKSPRSLTLAPQCRHIYHTF